MDFVSNAIRVRRVVFMTAVSSLALRIALAMRNFGIGLKGRSFAHGSFHNAIAGRDELEKFGGRWT